MLRRPHSLRPCAVLLAVITAGCGITQPKSCTPARVNTVSLVYVRDSSGAELARGSVVIQRAAGDTVPAWFLLSVYTENGPAPLMGHVTSVTLVDASGGVVFTPQLRRSPYSTAESTMPLRDEAQIAELEARLEHETLSLVMTTDLAGISSLRAPLTFNAALSGTVAPICFAPCRFFCE